MAIEGPLRELGIHDVFALLDLSRKTGTLRVTSDLRDNEGTVVFENGKVVYASIRSNPHPLGQLLLRAGKVTEQDLVRARTRQTKQGDTRRLGDILVATGAVTQKELDRQMRAQIEAVVFELLSWREGFFSFIEEDVSSIAMDAQASLSAEALLMEGARRIDEWSRLADIVPNSDVVPALADPTDGGEGPLELLPDEWDVLAAIDGRRDLRGLAAEVAKSEFDVAKVVYGLVATGVIAVDRPHEDGADLSLPMATAHAFLHEARRAFRQGEFDGAFFAAQRALDADPDDPEAAMLLGDILLRQRRPTDAARAFDRASRLAPTSVKVQRARGVAAALAGDFAGAVRAWGRAIELAPTDAQVERLRSSLEAAARLRRTTEEYVGA